jgi:hypothetical protein
VSQKRSKLSRINRARGQGERLLSGMRSGVVTREFGAMSFSASSALLGAFDDPDVPNDCVAEQLPRGLIRGALIR